VKEIYRLQEKLVNSPETAALAVRKVITNSGGGTPGIDQEKWESPEARIEAIALLGEIARNPKIYQAAPVRRVEIPKPGTTEKRPLGIPTLIDRAVQALYHSAIDPVVECHSDPNSYGFRKYRSAHDAINYLRTRLDKAFSPEWILETDIEKCFDNISHQFLLRHTPIYHKSVLEQWLQAGIYHMNHKIEIPTSGTPQGGIISPLLCNITLNGMEPLIRKRFPPKHDPRLGCNPKVHLIRYADDLVVTGINEQQLGEVKTLLEEFLAV